MKLQQIIPIAPDTHPADNDTQQVGDGLLFCRKYGIREAAKMVGIGETKMREFIRNGVIPAIMLDGKYLLLEQDLEAFLVSHYGRISVVPKASTRLPPLPERIISSDVLRKAS